MFEKFKSLSREELDKGQLSNVEPILYVGWISAKMILSYPTSLHTVKLGWAVKV